MRSTVTLCAPLLLAAVLGCEQASSSNKEFAPDSPRNPQSGAPALEQFKANSDRVIADYLRDHEIVKLQLGAGSSRLEGWLNTDIEPGDGLAYLDATERFPFDDGTVHYIFSEHVIEHLTYEQGKQMIAEAFRVLAPGGKMRVATPDLMQFIALFDKEPGEEAKAYIVGKLRWHEWPTEPNAPAIILNLQLSSWGHKFVYDYPTLAASLTAGGFVNPRRVEENTSDDEHLRNLEERGSSDMSRWNRYETMSIEVEKPAATTR